ncbi:putative S-methyl-5-thioadenosine phosphorylase [Phycisphaera mikurensis NBRC 102666]|uniref:Purine nucleoside phosphorylase n=1 Tax=Phycisphaera mikurensis (strain NBRC 102666 / KCTC 22515 / FYK2301M01) TaxID=1142394 RepID=I0IFL4_PHYMF|nr:putative S-methyl-5-thioadenosine phosphorylase [Phycisphaera mikurensis NBRC 102666]
MDEVKVGVIAGSGMGEALAEEGGEAITVETPFGPPASPIVKTRWEGTDVFVLQRHGPRHAFNPSAVPYRANVCALKQLGVTHVLASAAVGSLREDVQPGELMILDQLIDRTLGRPRTFFDAAAVHVEFAEPFCPVMRRWLIEAADRLSGGGANEQSDQRRVHRQGTMMVMEGPSFSTRAESRMYRQWGGDVIGMTGLPEARLAREAEMAYASLAMPTDYDSWKPGEAASESLLEEILGNLQVAVASSLSLVREALRHTGRLRREASPAHRALDHAIWTQKADIDPAEVQRLQPLWGRHFPTHDAG